MTADVFVDTNVLPTEGLLEQHAQHVTFVARSGRVGRPCHNGDGGWVCLCDRTRR